MTYKRRGEAPYEDEQEFHHTNDLFHWNFSFSYTPSSLINLNETNGACWSVGGIVRGRDWCRLPCGVKSSRDSSLFSSNNHLLLLLTIFALLRRKWRILKRNILEERKTLKMLACSGYVSSNVAAHTPGDKLRIYQLNNSSSCLKFFAWPHGMTFRIWVFKFYLA